MTPKEKAKELVQMMSMGEELNGSLELMELYPVPKNKHAKECAIIAIDEVLQYSKAHGFVGLTEHYEEVKKEIEKL